MDIKNRLIKIISTEELTSAAFADAIGVQRSSISHIISGRNKPSLDFLQKILTNFPKYSAEWLVLDEGEMYKSVTQSDLFNNLPKDNLTDTTITNVNSLKESNFSEKFSHSKTLKSETIIKEEDVPPYKSETSAIQSNINKTNDKKVEKIVIFYCDRTFSEYYPSK